MVAVSCICSVKHTPMADSRSCACGLLDARGSARQHLPAVPRVSDLLWGVNYVLNHEYVTAYGIPLGPNMSQTCMRIGGINFTPSKSRMRKSNIDN